MRFPKPFFRASKDAWYLQLGKRQISLGKDRDEAFERYREILLHEQGQTAEPALQRLTVAKVFDLFLEWSSGHNDSRTYEWYRMFLQDFSDRHGNRLVRELAPDPVGLFREDDPTSESSGSEGGRAGAESSTDDSDVCP